MTVAAQWPWLNLHDDVRFTLGPLRAAWESRGPLDTFVHRPMANRVTMAGLDALTAGPVPLREKITVGWAIVAVAGASAVLHAALLRRTGTRVATAVALAVFGSLAWASEAYVLQPEWTATVFSVLGLGLALLGLGRRTGSPRAFLVLFGAAAVLLAFAALQKYTTVTAAALALLVLFVVDRRRALLLGAASAILTVALLLISFAVGAREWQWFTETSRLNPAAGLRLDAFGEWTVNWVWNNPMLVAWPAAAALATRLTGRREWVWGSVAAFSGVLIVIVAQNQFFGYHGTPLLPAAAAVLAVAAVGWTERTGRLLLGLWPLVGWVAISWVLLRQPVGWRFGYRDAMAGWLLLVVVAIALVVWAQARSAGPVAGPRPLPLALTAVLLTLTMTFAGWPATPYGFFGQDRSRRSEVERQGELIRDGQRVREVVGDAPVAYLADGETVYFVASPTGCAYPGAVPLYRSDLARVPELRSFTENLSCLSDPAARFLVLQTWRVPFDELDPRVGETVTREYDCDAGTVIRELLVCPRR